MSSETVASRVVLERDESEADEVSAFAAAAGAVYMV